MTTETADGTAVKWYVARGQRPDGPYDEEGMRALVREGKLTPADRVWGEGMAGWVTADQFPGWFPEGSLPPPVPVQVAYAGPMPQTEDIGQNAGVRMLIPVGRSPWAIAAGYLGLFGLFGGFLAPAAIVAAIFAFREIKRDPTKHGMGRAITGLVLGVIGTLFLVVLIVAVLAR